MSTHPRPHLDRLTEALRELHRGLVEVMRKDYEQAQGPVGSAGQLLHLLMHDPAFAWLRPLSTLMADVDALLDQPGPVALDDAAAARLEVELLLKVTEADEERPEGVEASFAFHYFEVLQREPMIAGEHAQLRKALADLPAAETEHHPGLRDKRRTWTEASRVHLRQHLAEKHKAGHKPS